MSQTINANEVQNDSRREKKLLFSAWNWILLNGCNEGRIVMLNKSGAVGQRLSLSEGANWKLDWSKEEYAEKFFRNNVPIPEHFRWLTNTFAMGEHGRQSVIYPWYAIFILINISQDKTLFWQNIVLTKHYPDRTLFWQNTIPIKKIWKE